MEKDSKKRFMVPKWMANVGKIAAVTVLTVVAGVVAVASMNEDKTEAELPDEDYIPVARPKKEFYSDFELADFCRGGELTED